MADRIIIIEDKDNNYTTLELSQQNNDNKYIISSSNNKNIDIIIKDLNMIREDIHKYNVGDCLSCFCQYNPNRFQCARCNKSINIFNIIISCYDIYNHNHFKLLEIALNNKLNNNTDLIYNIINYYYYIIFEENDIMTHWNIKSYNDKLILYNKYIKLLYIFVSLTYNKVSSIFVFIKMNMLYETENDSVLFSTYDPGVGAIQLPCSAPTFHGDAMEGFCLLGKGDSAIFLMSYDSLYKNQPMKPEFATKGGFLKLRVKVLDLMTKEEYDAYQTAAAAAQVKIDDDAIQKYCVDHNINAQKTQSTCQTQKGACLRSNNVMH